MAETQNEDTMASVTDTNMQTNDNDIHADELEEGEVEEQMENPAPSSNVNPRALQLALDQVTNLFAPRYQYLPSLHRWTQIRLTQTKRILRGNRGMCPK